MNCFQFVSLIYWVQLYILRYVSLRPNTCKFSGDLCKVASNVTTRQPACRNTIWVIGLFGDFVVNFAYCVYLLNKNKTWKDFFKHESYNWGLASSAGWLWYGSVMFYGMAVSKLGAFGASIDWEMYKSLGLVFGNEIDIMTKEWKGSTKNVFFQIILLFA